MRNVLLALDFAELPEDVWLRSPPHESPSQLLRRLNLALDAASPSGDVPGLAVIDPETSVSYYRGRWRSPRKERGRFVGRRPQLYGAPVWCFVELESGRACKLVDLPVDRGPWRGFDEAWRVQAAIDALRGTPQYFRTWEAVGGGIVFDFFSPVPSWARRRWDSIGDPVQSPRSLFAHLIPRAEVEEEVGFCRERLWLKHTAADNSNQA